VIRNSKTVYEVMEGSTPFAMKNKTEARAVLGLEGKTVFLWVGRLNANKDPLTVLKAFAPFSKTHPGAKLQMIYGTNEMEQEVKQFIKEQNLDSNVELTGRLKREELEKYYQAAQYFILGSHYEGSGYALCEAMACGCVPVVTNIDSFSAMLDDGNCGYLFEPGNSSQLLRILEGLNDREQENLRDKVLDKFQRDLSFEGIGKKMAEIITGLTGKAT
jgi:glycosyltransferase involved in cell wall biosynthesis